MSQAKARGLAQRQEWMDLLHFKRHPLTRQRRSLADGTEFFNAPTGFRDAQAEMDATLVAFFDPSPHRAGDQSARCRFVARWQWLRSVLSIDEDRLPPARCLAYEAWREGLHAHSLSLVFPAAYVNSPASMYGHTLFRINPSGAYAQQPLLAYSISYAAAGNESEGLAFVVKGLTGMYPGLFTTSPYYLRTQDYTHLENRDIWEYELNLTPQELDQLLAHAWELRYTRFNYYFFDENCAYHLLSLLDVARPSLRLTDQFTWWAIPVDTVRAVVESQGLLKSRHYRPSNGTELEFRAAQLPVAAQARARALAEGAAAEHVPAPSVDPVEEARTLELSERYLTWLASRRGGGEAAYQRQRMPLLSARAKLPTLPDVTLPTPGQAPEQGHKTARSALSVGGRNGQSAWTLQGRAAYHDILDPEAGFQRGAQIQFFDFSVGQVAGGRPRLEHLTPVDIVSLTPRGTWVGGQSWKVRFGATRSFAEPTASAKLAGEFNGGPGWAWELGSKRASMVFAFMDNQLWWDPALAGAKDVALGSGLHWGWMVDASSEARFLLEWRQRYFLGQAEREQSLDIRHRYRLSLDSNLIVNCAWRRRGEGETQRRTRECLMGWQRYW